MKKNHLVLAYGVKEMVSDDEYGGGMCRLAFSCIRTFNCQIIVLFHIRENKIPLHEFLYRSLKES